MNQPYDEESVRPEPPSDLEPPASTPSRASGGRPLMPAWDAQTTRDPRRKSVLLAILLSMMPGLGQVYVGYYRRGFIHILTVASLITMLANDFGPLNPLLGLGLAFFWLYNMVDAGRRASYSNMLIEAQAGGMLPEDIDLSRFEGGTRAGGAVLILLGFMFLMHTRFRWDFYWVEEWWPLGFILLGGYLIYRDMQSRSRKD